MNAPSELVDALVDAFRARMVAAMEKLGASRTPEEFCSAERDVHALARELAAEVTREALQQMSDDAERRSQALARVRDLAASRGIRIRQERDRKTQVRTLNGRVIEVKTPYATARPRAGARLEKRGTQGTGVYPVLDQLGIGGRSTPALRLQISRAVCEANSVASARELLAGGGVELGHKTALRLTYMVCDDALRARKRAMKAKQAGDEEGEFAGRRVVVTVDGGRINIRKRVGGRRKKGGRSRFETEWREPKILTLYVLDDQGKRDRKVRSVIDGTLGDADAVFELVVYHLRCLGAHKATELALVGDAALWIWNRAEKLRQALGVPRERFHEIIDYFHVVERLGDFAKSRTDWCDESRRIWLKVQKQRLKAGHIEAIESVFHNLVKGWGEDLDTELDYWNRNRERLRYAAFRERGLPNGSGAVESSVRRVVNLRLKGASITWTEEHAEGVLHLRAHAKSGRWDELEATVLRNTGWRPTARQVRPAL